MSTTWNWTDASELCVEGKGWADTLKNFGPAVQVVWGCTIIALLVTYGLATVALGYRFSNLTYRGTVTCGPYRFTKHPAYVAKCSAWALIWLPLWGHVDRSMGWRSTVMLAGLCFVYYLRAKTEERHLSRYPEYVTYAKWINEHGIFKGLARWLPFLKYRCPVTPETSSSMADIAQSKVA